MGSDPLGLSPTPARAARINVANYAGPPLGVDFGSISPASAASTLSMSSGQIQLLNVLLALAHTFTYPALLEMGTLGISVPAPVR